MAERPTCTPRGDAGQPEGASDVGRVHRGRKRLIFLLCPKQPARSLLQIGALRRSGRPRGSNPTHWPGRIAPMQDQITTCLVDNDAGVWEARLSGKHHVQRQRGFKGIALRGIDQAPLLSATATGRIPPNGRRCRPTSRRGGLTRRYWPDPQDGVQNLPRAW